MDYNYIKSLHLIFVITWFAGLFYIVRLFVYQVEAAAMPEPEREILRKQYKNHGLSAMVYHHLAVGGAGYDFCRDAALHDAGLVATGVDARKTGLRALAVPLPFPMPPYFQAIAAR